MAGLNDNGRGSYGGGGYNNNRSGYSNSYNGNRSSSGSYNSRSSYGQQKELPPEITPKKVPEGLCRRSRAYYAQPHEPAPKK